MTDDVGPGWLVDAGLRSAMRLTAVRQAAEREDWPATLVEAEELLDEEPDHVEALCWVAEAMMALDDPFGARMVFQDLLDRGEATADVHSGLAHTSLELCDFTNAVAHGRIATQLAPDSPAAWYTLSVALEWTEASNSQALSALLMANRLAPEHFPMPIDLSTDEWREAVEQAMHEVAPEVGELWSGVPIRLEHYPTLEELLAATGSIPPTIGGLVDGTPDPLRPGEPPPMLRLFLGNLCRAGSYEAVIGELMATLEDEAEAWWETPAAEA